ncbi:hypothetical protein H4F38_09975 [Pectobacterium brasiliense]|nr:hypothetical protein [Pectobacterium brasiliense]MBN3098080.1 hypothetical protein [Pectobacterium brasiliense]MBN3180980.1 hypothetical protein [Pectobacterium brasiliense]PPE62894.1 hypothetical protein F152LOC_01851 [Pectobacterium brasiliense]
MIYKIKNFYRQHKRKVIFCIAIIGGLTYYIDTAVTFGRNFSEVSSFIMKLNPMSQENSSPPFKIGMKITDVEKVIGEPQRVNFIAKSYFSHGIEINPDYENPDNVGGITVKTLPSGVMYKGKVDGIRLNTSFEEVKKNKGNPTYWGVESAKSSIAIWYENEMLTIVHFTPGKDEIWQSDSITYTKSASIVAYRAILLSVFQELKAGRVSQFAEELAERENTDFFKDNDLGLISLSSFSQQYLHLDYEFVLMKPAIGGGVELYLAFGEKLLYFWIYPLAWEKPTVRAIIDLDLYHTNHDR